MPRTAVVFDLFHTLVPGADAARDRGIEEMAAVVGVDPAAFVRVFHESWPDRLVRWDPAETVRILAGRLGAHPTDAAVAEAVRIRCALGARLLDDVKPSTLDALDALRADGFRLAVLSNTTAETTHLWPATRLAERFDVAVFSPEVGLAKPDPRIYQVAADRLGVRTVDCWFVGDGADGELAGAAAVGMAVIRTTEFQDTDPSWPGQRIGEIGEIGELTRGLYSNS
ncbi:HAD-IA family hydrolase [Asanoa sp. NPDC049518]|uniref:HAD family hydrolase n=1 Tax=unclassified Asanoa TaxID=2685164 RepID=UPI0034331C6A